MVGRPELGSRAGRPEPTTVTPRRPHTPSTNSWSPAATCLARLPSRQPCASPRALPLPPASLCVWLSSLRPSLLGPAGWQLLLSGLGPPGAVPPPPHPPFPLCSLPIGSRPLPPPLSEAHQWQAVVSSTSSPEPLPRSARPPQPTGRHLLSAPQPGHKHSFTCPVTHCPPPAPAPRTLPTPPTLGPPRARWAWNKRGVMGLGHPDPLGGPAVCLTRHLARWPQSRASGTATGLCSE